MQIRPATPADWPAIWAFLREVLAAGDTYTYPRDISQADAEQAWLLAPPWQALVAIDSADRPVAIAKYGPNLPGQGAHVANASFVVDPAVSGSGVGRALAEEVLKRARTEGFRAMQFNAVVETNTSAIGLWESLGFKTLATVPGAFAHPGAGLVGLKIMYRSL